MKKYDVSLECSVEDKEKNFGMLIEVHVRNAGDVESVGQAIQKAADTIKLPDTVTEPKE